MEEGPKLGQFILLKIDFEKAYDQLEWRFLQHYLGAMNCGPRFCS